MAFDERQRHHLGNHRIRSTVIQSILVGFRILVIVLVVPLGVLLSSTGGALADDRQGMRMRQRCP
ncbi:unnamed protein product [Phyllotreta striolata]|uniref:Uncharacterized protein n=1 Tax=Phyllotreta striolata TaxID=444603 RepID=A0A9N9U1I9_PHYSR|nr:unnamed protein product [Phyllotreta striolata]